MKAIVVLATALFAAGPAPAAAQSQLIDLAIAAGKAGEICLPLRAGDTLDWTFEANAPADFNLHHHVGKDVLMPVERNAVRTDRARHRADRANDWCLMWTAPRAQGITVGGSWRVEPAAAK